MTRLRLCLTATLTGLFVLVPTAAASQLRTVDISTAPRYPAPLPRDFYEAQGVVLNRTYYVSLVQGDEAVVLDGGIARGIAGTFRGPPARSISVEVAPAFQGTASYTLTARDQRDRVVGRKSVIRTEDTGDPADQGFGYFTVAVGSLPRPARSFTVTNQFIRRSYGPLRCVGGGTACFSFGLSTITWGIDRGGSEHSRIGAAAARPACFKEPATIVGTPGDDRIRGTNQPDVIVARGGNDVVRGRGGHDRICAGRGEDEVHGGTAEDFIRGSRGADVLRGSGGGSHELIYGNGGTDRVIGGDGEDTLSGGGARDRIWGDTPGGGGNPGSDFPIVGGPGADIIHGGAETDSISGAAGSDTIYGDAGRDFVRGQKGEDRLAGGDDIDSILGQDGDDDLFGSRGDDRLFGQLGDDDLDGGDGTDYCAQGPGAGLIRNCEP